MSACDGEFCLSVSHVFEALDSGLFLQNLVPSCSFTPNGCERDFAFECVFMKFDVLFILAGCCKISHSLLLSDNASLVCCLNSGFAQGYLKCLRYSFNTQKLSLLREVFFDDVGLFRRRMSI